MFVRSDATMYFSPDVALQNIYGQGSTIQLAASFAITDPKIKAPYPQLASNAILSISGDPWWACSNQSLAPSPANGPI